MVARGVTAAQWEEVVECLTLSGRAAGAWAEANGNFIEIHRGLRNGGVEVIQFVRESTGLPAYSVRSRTRVSDPNYAWRESISGPTAITRRLQLQLDAQCLGSFPILGSSGAE
jgi:hypothetical protein